jgi:hypothetical protein
MALGGSERARLLPRVQSAECIPSAARPVLEYGEHNARSWNDGALASLKTSLFFSYRRVKVSGVLKMSLS